MNNVYDAEGVCGDAAYVSHDAMLNPVTSVRSCARVEPCLYITFSHFVNITSTIGARDMSDPWLSPQRPFAYASRKHRGALDLLRACPPTDICSTPPSQVYSPAPWPDWTVGALHLAKRLLPFREHQQVSRRRGRCRRGRCLGVQHWCKLAREASRVPQRKVCWHQPLQILRVSSHLCGVGGCTQAASQPSTAVTLEPAFCHANARTRARTHTHNYTPRGWCRRTQGSRKGDRRVAVPFQPTAPVRFTYPPSVHRHTQSEHHDRRLMRKHRYSHAT